MHFVSLFFFFAEDPLSWCKTSEQVVVSCSYASAPLDGHKQKKEMFFFEDCVKNRFQSWDRVCQVKTTQGALLSSLFTTFFGRDLLHAGLLYTHAACKLQLLWTDVLDFLMPHLSPSRCAAKAFSL